MWRQRIIQPGVVLPALLSVLLLTACQATGGGTAGCGTWESAAPVSSVPGGAAAGMSVKANAPGAGGRTTFGFVFDQTTSTFSGSYQDTCAGVALRGTGVLRADAPGQSPASLPCAGTIFGSPLAYEAQNPKIARDPAAPSGGTLNLWVCDFGTPGTGNDLFFLQVLDGPYAGYTNTGTLQAGNIQVQ